MAKSAKLIIEDECNVKFDGLDVVVRNKICSKLEFLIPSAIHTPAYKLGRWNGKISFANRGGRTALNLLDKVMQIVYDAGYVLDIEDHRAPLDLEFPTATEDMFAHICWPSGHPCEDEPIILRDYQVECLNNFLQNPQSIQEISTGAGKTLLTAAMSKLVEPYGRTIVIVPSRDLVTQTEEDYRNLQLDVGVFYGGRNEWNKTHTICTWQSLSALDRKSKNAMTDAQISEFLDGVVCVIVDEVHTSKADVLRKLLMGPFRHCPIRWGLTGTVPKEEYEYFSILAAIGPVVNRLSAKELQDKDVLANCHVEIRQLIEFVEYKTYAEETKFLLTNKERLFAIGEMIQEISNEGNTLVLVAQVEAGKKLQSAIPGSVFVHGAVKSVDRKAEYKSVNVEDNKVIIATYGVASTGINLPRIFNLVLIEPGKAFIRTIQSIGRGLRRAKDKDFVNIYDICSTLKFSKRHLTARKKYYNEAQYPFKIKKIDYR
jgi:superfamily II DNA or RNA helicase